MATGVPTGHRAGREAGRYLAAARWTPHQGGLGSQLPSPSPEVKAREDKCGFADPAFRAPTSTPSLGPSSGERTWPVQATGFGVCAWPIENRIAAMIAPIIARKRVVFNIPFSQMA